MHQKFEGNLGTPDPQNATKLILCLKYVLFGQGTAGGFQGLLAGQLLQSGNLENLGMKNAPTTTVAVAAVVGAQ